MERNSGGRVATKVLRIAVGILCIIGVLYLVNTDELVQALSQVSVLDIVILIGISGVLIAVSVIKWQLFLAHLGIRNSFLRLFGLYLVGYFVNIFTPSFIGGDVVRSLALGRGVNRAHALSATFLERYTGIVAMLGMAACAACFSAAVTEQILWVVAIAVIGCTVATWLLASGLIKRAIQFFPLPGRVAKTIDTVHEGLVLGLRDRSLLVRALLLSIVFHLLTIVNTVAVGTAVGWENIPWQGLLVVVPLILLVGAIPVSPQGLGIQEGAFVYFLHAVGASPAQALAVALVLRAKSYLLAVVGGVVWLLCRDQLGARADAAREGAVQEVVQ